MLAIPLVLTKDISYANPRIDCVYGKTNDLERDAVMLPNAYAFETFSPAGYVFEVFRLGCVQTVPKHNDQPTDSDIGAGKHGK